MVARAIFNCSTPVISAVGHETDVTIADYVADLRAPTPSAAAELAVFDYSQFEEQVRLYSQVLNRSMERKLERLHFRLEQGKMRLKMRSPERQLADRRQRLADIESFLERRIKAVSYTHLDVYKRQSQGCQRDIKCWSRSSFIPCSCS